MLNRNRGDLGISKTLWNKHDTDSQTADDVLNQPLRVVVGKPLQDGQLLEEILDGGGGETLGDWLDPAFDSVDVGIRAVVRGCFLRGPGPPAAEFGPETHGEGFVMAGRRGLNCGSEGGGEAASLGQVYWLPDKSIEREREGATCV